MQAFNKLKAKKKPKPPPPPVDDVAANVTTAANDTADIGKPQDLVVSA